MSDGKGNREAMLQADGEEMFQLGIEWMLWELHGAFHVAECVENGMGESDPKSNLR